MKRILFLVPLFFFWIIPAQAAGIVGNGTPGSCTEATLNAALSGGGLVTFNCGPTPHTILLTSEKVITADTTVDGSNLIILSGGGTSRIFHIMGGVSFTAQNLSLINGFTTLEGGGIYVEEQGELAVQNSHFSNNVSTQTAENYAGGGAISVERRSTAVITNSTFTNNQAGNGGAIAMGGWNSKDDGGTLTVTGSTFTNNIATEDGSIPGGGDGGGAIYLKGGSAGFVDSSTFSGNQAANGGAIHQLNADITITNSTFTDNISNHNFSGGGGGALYMDGGKNLSGGMTIQNSVFMGNRTNQAGGVMFSFPEGTETTLIQNSTFESNQSYGRGQAGAIYHQSAQGTGPLVIENSTFAYNDAYSTLPDGASQGGALWLYTAPVTIRNSTFYANDASNLALPADDWHRGFGGAFVSHTAVDITNSTFAYNTSGFVGGAIASDFVTIRNSLIAHNTGANPWGIQQNCTDALADGGNNLQFPAGECLNGSNVDPLLGPIGNYGGATQTLPLSPGSPAINGGNNATCPATDQRGVSRQGSACDSGAYEFGAGPVLTQINPTWAAVNSDGFILTLTGVEFTSQSVVRWGGVDHAIGYQNSFGITANILPADLTTAGDVAVTVYDPNTNSESAPLTFRVLPFLWELYLPVVLRGG